MSHVDDGTLHAYLDGELPWVEAQGLAAHMAQCPTCRTRLEEEQALIGRADELLGLAAPPHRDLPPLRTGDLRLPARLWWQVRLPLAWAATVALALGIGMYLGGGAAPVRESRAPVESDLASRRARQAPGTPQPARPPTRVSVPGAARSHPADEPPAPTPTPTVLHEADRAGGQRVAPAAVQPETLASTLLRNEVTTAAAEQGVVAKKAAAPSQPAVLSLEKDHDVLRGSPVSVDSARALLGTNLVAVPGLAIRGIYETRTPGYSAVVIVEQTLASGTAIEVIHRRAGARPRADTTVAVEPAPPGRGAPPSDSLDRVARRADAAPPRASERAADRGISSLVVEVRGPLTADSLGALRRRLQPLPR